MGSESQNVQTKWGRFRTIHYYAQGLLDLEDILASINRMIEQRIPAGERAEVKRLCHVSALAMKGRSAGMLLRVTLPCNAVYAEHAEDNGNEPAVESSIEEPSVEEQVIASVGASSETK